MAIIVCVILSLLAGRVVLTTAAVVVVIIIPMIMLIFREPLENLLRRRIASCPVRKHVFVESSFEIFETVLNFFSGTPVLSACGAFALNHAGLSLAVWSLPG